MRQRQAHDRVAGLQQRVVDGGVGLRAGVRLDVGVLGAEQRLGAVDRELLGDVHPLAAAVVAAPGIALGVLVGQHRALALEHRAGHEVLRGDHLERALLALELAAQDLGDLGIDLGERAVEVVGAELSSDTALSLAGDDDLVPRRAACSLAAPRWSIPPQAPVAAAVDEASTRGAGGHAAQATVASAASTSRRGQRALAQHVPAPLGAVVAQVDDRRGRARAARRRRARGRRRRAALRAPRSSVRASGSPEMLALDCITGDRHARTARAGARAAAARAGRASPGRSCRRARSAARGWRAAASRGPGSSACSAAALGVAAARGSVASAGSSAKNMTAAGRAAGRPLSSYRRAGRLLVLGVAADRRRRCRWGTPPRRRRPGTAASARPRPARVALTPRSSRWRSRDHHPLDAARGRARSGIASKPAARDQRGDGGRLPGADLQREQPHRPRSRASCVEQRADHLQPVGAGEQRLGRARGARSPAPATRARDSAT